MTDIDVVQQFADKHRLHTRVDDDLTKIIPGKVGHIYEYDEDRMGVVIIPDPPRVNYWGFAKRALVAVGCMVVQDGDGEGAATFDPNNLQQVRAAIKAAKIKRKRVMSEKQKAVLDRARKASPLMRRRQDEP